MAKIPYFPFYPDDWISSRKRLGLTYKQQGIYILLLSHSWHGPLPSDRFRLQQLAPGARFSDIEIVLSTCFSTANEQHTNDKLTAIRQQREHVSQQASYAAKCLHNKESGNADAERTQSGRPANQNQNQNQNHIEPKDIGTRKKRDPFSKPTIDEIKKYCLEKGYLTFDAEKFHAYYESNGWRVGKNPMKSWAAAITTWRKNDFGGSGNGQRPYQPVCESPKEKRAREAREEIRRRFGLAPGDTPRPPDIHSAGNEHRRPSQMGETIIDNTGVEVEPGV